MNVGNNGVGVHSVGLDVGSDGVSVRGAVANFRSYIRIHRELSLGIGVSHFHTGTIERTLKI